MYKHRLLTFLLTVIPHCDGAIPNDLYWECQAEGIDPEVVFDLYMAGDTDALAKLLVEAKSEDLLDSESEDLFRLEVLQDLEANGIEYVDGYFYLQADIHNS